MEYNRRKITPIQAMNDSELDQLLKATTADVPLPAGFQREVWSRIEASDAAGWKPRINRAVERFLGFFALPPVAVATCSAMVMVGAWFGLQSKDTNPVNKLAYIESISPFAHTHR